MLNLKSYAHLRDPLSDFAFASDGYSETRMCSASSGDRYEIQPGQVWSYKTRPGEDVSTVTILRVESLPKIGTIVHVRIEGIHLKNCGGGPSPSTIQHAPFAREALDKSVTALIKSNVAIPDYEEGYQEWLSHCGGVYTITLADMLNVDETTFNTGSGCNS